MKAFIIYPTYKIEDNKAYVYLFGRLENGESFLAINYFRPYFFIKTKDKKKAEELKLEYEETDFKDFEDNEVTKVTLDIPKDVPKIKKTLQDKNVVCYEADIRFAYRFLIDNDIKASMKIDGDYEKGEFVNRIYKEPKLTPTTYFPKLKVLSIDIETNKENDDLYSISLYTDDYNTVLIKKEGKFKDAESFTDEKTLLTRFKELVLKLDPDIITGWNLIDFDLKILQKKFMDNKIPFQLGRINWECKLNLTDSFYIDSKADFPGRVVLDGIHLLKISFIKLPDYKLNTASSIFLKEKKIFTAKDRYKEIDNAYKNDPELLIKYNLKDAKMVYDILNVSKTLELTINRSIITRMQLDRVNASVASLDSVYIKELQKRKIVAPSSFVTDTEERIKGGFVRESKPGIYTNILVFDFKSLYPSIIKTFNIDPYSFVNEKDLKKYEKSELIKAPNNAYFRNDEGILPHLIDELWHKRDKAKKEGNKLEANAVKILMNSFFGCLANPTCRFYSLEIANAITHFGQFIIKLTAEELEKQGYDVIYGDTDSIFVDVKTEKQKEALAIADKIQNFVNKFYDKYIKENYKRKSVLELEFEKLYKQFLMPKIRGTDIGAKKRYAGIVDKDIEFVGMEFVRRDWTELAKKFQLELLTKVFNNEKVDTYITKFIKDLKEGKYDNLLVYKKAIRKGVKEYTKTTPPHIKAARKAGVTEAGIVDYVMTTDGPELVEFQKNKIDYEHYIEKQLKPIADSILDFYNLKFEDLAKGHKQANLFDF